MSTFLETVEQQYGTRDLYTVLGVEKNAEEADLKRAYRRLSLKVHPDRVEPEEVATATEKFQVPLTHHVTQALLTLKASIAITPVPQSIPFPDTWQDLCCPDRQRQESGL